MKKYTLLKPRKDGLRRIKALRDFVDIKKGQLGGLVSGYHNLSQEGNCWIYENARVFENARVCESAIVSGNARVCESAIVSGNAIVCESAIVSGNAIVSWNAIVSGNATVSGNARVKNGNHTQPVVVFQLSKHSITVDGNHLNIGCCSGTIEEWLTQYEVIGKRNEYTEKEIKEYGNAIKFIAENYFTQK